MTSAVETKGLAEWRALYEASNAIFRAAELALVPHRLSLPQLLTLAALDAAGKALTIGELARALVKESQTMTGIVDRLESAGFVKRVFDRLDRRKTWIRLTDQGQEKLKATMPTFSQVIAAIFYSLPDEQLDSLLVVSQRLAEHALIHQGARS